MAASSRRFDDIPDEVWSAIDRVGRAEDPRVGEVIGDRYRVVRPLAEGGMGRVYVGEHLEIGLPVAIKLLPVETADEAGIKRFRREATAAAQLRSPNVVQVFDFGRTRDGAFYLVMELLEGRDLASRTAHEGLPGVEAALDVLRQIARALDHAHARGIVHRDLKPENVFVCEGAGEGVVKVLDFGVAKSFLRGGMTVTDVGTVLGTPAFMAPEQALGAIDRVGPASDRYALAALALELLTGQTPYPYETATRTLQALVDEPPRMPSELGLVIDGLDEIFERGMARDADARFESAEAFVEALEAALASALLEPTPTRGTPRSSLVRSLRPRARRVDTGAHTQAARAPSSQPELAAMPAPATSGGATSSAAQDPAPRPESASTTARLPAPARWPLRTGLTLAIGALCFAAGWLAGALARLP